MKFASLAIGLAVAAVAMPAVAQTAPAPADAPAAAAALFTTDTPIEALIADERAKAVLAKHLGPIDQHPAYEQFKAMSLRALAPFSQGMITDDMIGKIEADLAAIK